MKVPYFFLFLSEDSHIPHKKLHRQQRRRASLSSSVFFFIISSPPLPFLNPIGKKVPHSYLGCLISGTLKDKVGVILCEQIPWKDPYCSIFLSAISGRQKQTKHAIKKKNCLWSPIAPLLTSTHKRLRARTAICCYLLLMVLGDAGQCRPLSYIYLKVPSPAMYRGCGRVRSAGLGVVWDTLYFV